MHRHPHIYAHTLTYTYQHTFTHNLPCPGSCAHLHVLTHIYRPSLPPAHTLSRNHHTHQYTHTPSR